MQARKLTMKNIGPFVGTHVIDFTVLDKIFLISGKTGSGKTTILDALTYALYGSLPGARKTNDKRHLRSDFCSSQEECSISFDFLLHGCHYRVERTLPFMRTTRNATQKEEGETALLYRIKIEAVGQETEKSSQGDLFAQGDSSANDELLASQKSETDSLLKSLLSLSLDEFSRIVLLPQGEFAVFLRQNSNERKAMLSKLFPVEQFSRITERLREYKSRQSASLEVVMSQLDFLRQTYNPDTADEQKEQCVKSLEEAKSGAEKNQKTMYAIRSKLQTLQEQSNQFAEFQRIEKQLTAVLMQKEQIDLDRERIGLSNEAAKIDPFVRSYGSAQSELQKTALELQKCRDQSLQCEKERTELSAQLTEHDAHKERLAEIGLLLHDLERARGSEQGLQEAQSLLKALQTELSAYQTDSSKNTAKIVPLDDFIRDAGDVQADWAVANREMQEASLNVLFAQDAVLKQTELAQDETTSNAKLILDEFIAADKKAKTEHLAASLAIDLQSGEACPVCGSMNHPTLALAPQSLLNSDKKIKTQEKLVAQAEQVLALTTGNRRELAGSIDQSKKSIPDYEHKPLAFSRIEDASENEINVRALLELAEKKLCEMENLLCKVEKARGEKDKLEATLIPLREKEILLAPRIATAQAQVEQSHTELVAILQKAGVDTKQFTPATEEQNAAHVIGVKETIFALAAEQAGIIQKTESFEKCQKTNAEQGVRLEERGTLLKTDLTDGKVQVEKCQSDLDAAVEKSVFATTTPPTLTEQSDNKAKYDALRKCVEQALLGEANQHVIEAKIEGYKTEKLRLETLHTEKKSALHGDATDMAQHTAALQEEETALLQTMQEANNALSSAQQQITQLEAQTKEYSELESRRKKISAELEQYTLLHNAVSGNNPKKIPLDSWVLGMYLEEITNFASQRLERISDGRYTMYLKTESEGGRGFKGLDLEIYDAHTGKRRPCSTLSGGETFMASISLALAISDTVQARNGGIQLDSLFIDEGFGSLDPDALEKALGILDEIRETRSIGLISHVDSLKNRIPSQIKITKSLAGSTLEIGE